MHLRAGIGAFFVTVILVGAMSGCSAAPKLPVFLDATAWPKAHSVVLVGISYDPAYRPHPQSGLERQLAMWLRRKLQAKGFLVTGPPGSCLLLRHDLRAVAGTDLLAMASASVDLVVAVHVDFLFSSDMYGEVFPPPEFEIAAEARAVDGKTGQELWRDRGHALQGGASAVLLATPDYDRLLGLARLADSLFETLPDADMPPPAP